MTKRTAYKKRGGERNAPRHAFIFQVGGQKPVKVFSKVRPATKPVEIVLTEEHVRRAMKLNGHGDAQNCAGAVCVKSHSDAFPHGFSGHVDWLSNRVYVADANTSIGLPKTCVAYRLRGVAQKVAPLFDTKAGLQKLLDRVRRDGKLVLQLEPPTYSPREKGRPKGEPDAEQRRKVGAKGHKLRLTRIGSGANFFKELTKIA